LSTKYSVALVDPSLTANGSVGCVRFDALLSQVPCKLMAPVPQLCFSNVQSTPLLAYRLYDCMDVGMRFIGVQYKRVSMLERKLLAQEVSYCR
jgi:hypothetical protein